MEIKNKKILIVEDDTTVLSFLKRGLKTEGYHVDSAMTGSEAIKKAVLTNPDSIILDRKLPDDDGIVICKSLREQGFINQIIMLTARDAVQDRVDGLNSGADDYICKPFSFEELIARINAIDRRDLFNEKYASKETLDVGCVSIDLNNRKVYCNNELISLTKTEFDLLSYFALNEGKVLSKDDILRSVWGYNNQTETKLVEVYVGYLRKKLNTCSNDLQIDSIRGFGYQFVV